MFCKRVLEPAIFRLVSYHASLSLWNLRCLGWYLIICWLVLLEPTTARLIADSFMQAILFSGTYDIYAYIISWKHFSPEPTVFRLICYYFMQVYPSVTYNGYSLISYHFMQACPSGTYGANCSSVCACGAGASHCDVIMGCVCMTGWTGDKCHLDVNECGVESTRQQCESKGARCVNFDGGFRCQCNQGYTMDNDTGCQGNECYL